MDEITERQIERMIEDHLLNRITEDLPEIVRKSVFYTPELRAKLEAKRLAQTKSTIKNKRNG